MPSRADQRPAHARPRVLAPDRPYHPLTPLSERDRGVWSRHRRLVGVAAAALVLAVSIPLLGATFGSTSAPIPQPAGAVAGVQATPLPSVPTRPSGSPAPVAVGGATSAVGSGTVTTGRSTAITWAATDRDAPRLHASLVAPPVTSLTGYRWPLATGRITLPFKAIPGGEWINDGKLFHDGVDMASFCGAAVRSAHDGVVLAAGRHFDEQLGWLGNLGPYFHRLDSQHLWNELPIVVVIDDGNGYRSIYAHFHDTTVKVGQHVEAGQLIGHEGATGHASGCHVHYGLFSPAETKTFGVRADIVRRMKLPPFEIARIDPLLVLPGGAVALRTRSIAKAIESAKSGPATH